MLRIDRLCVLIFLAGFALLTLSYRIFTFVDELIIGLLLMCAVADCLINRSWAKYKPLIIFMGVMCFYLVYSLTVVHYNSTASVVLGWFLEMKPFITILVFMIVAPKFGPTELKLLRGIALFNGGIVLISTVFMSYARALIFGHDALFGATALTSAIVYLFADMNEERGFSRRGLLVFFILMTVGLMSGRSKFYGEYIIILFMIFGYKQQITKHLTGGKLFGVILMGVIVLAAVWNKLDSYFLSGLDLSTFDFESRDEFARLALYGMTFEVLSMSPVFGTGFGSYASFASGDPGYSQVYVELGLDKVYGLSPDFHEFISDAYYPSLAQYGVVGIVIFIYFWVYVYNKLRPLTRIIGEYERALFIVGAFILISFFIEMTSGTVLFMAPGELLGCVLGTICGIAGRLKGRENEYESSSKPKEEAQVRIT